MKLTIVVPSEQYLSLAGTRIRYQRMADPLARNGWTMDLVPIERLADRRDFTDTQAFLFSKVQDARAVAMATEIRERGGVVGIDLFDDYFSQRGDSRLATQRNWLRAMAGSIDFVLCSTPRMQAVAASYSGNASNHVLNDPFGRLDAAQLAADLASKREQTMRTGRLPVVWFGTGDNPTFPVGLHDLVAWHDTLAHLAQGPFHVELTILTNLRALDVKGLALLRRLPVSMKVEEWSEAREKEALATSLVSFIPVNAQPFSIAKSLNRGVSALTGGTQLLSAGFPLYAPLDDFIYRDPAQLLADLEADALRNAPERLERFTTCLDSLANPEIEAAKWAAFLTSIQLGRVAPAPRRIGEIAILHGGKTSGGIHKFAQQRGWLSFGSPFTPPGVPFDAHLGLFGNGRLPGLRLSKRAKDMLPKSLRNFATSAAKSSGKGPPFELPLACVEAAPSLADLAATAACSIGDRIALYPHIMAEMRRLYNQLFGRLHFVTSELDPALNLASLMAEPLAEPEPA